MENRQPVFMVQHGPVNDQEYSLYYLLEDHWDHYPGIAATLHDKTVLPTYFGCFFLMDIEGNCSLWYSEINIELELPQLLGPGPVVHQQCALSRPPYEPDCQILLKTNYGLAFCEVDDEEFKYLELPIVSNEIEYDCVEALMPFSRDIYALVRSGIEVILVRVAFVGQRVEFVPILDIPPWHASLNHCVKFYLVDSESYGGNVILLVSRINPADYIFDCAYFRIHQIDLQNGDCVELHDISERAIFVSHSGYAFCSSFPGIRQSCVYSPARESSLTVTIYTLDKLGEITLFEPVPAHHRHASFLVDHRFFPRL